MARHHCTGRRGTTQPKRPQLLLTQEAEICAKDTWGRTPLHCAAWKNAAETTEVLLTQGANINEKDEHSGDTAALCRDGQCD